MKNEKIIVISIDGADEGAVAEVVSCVARLCPVISVNAFEPENVRITEYLDDEICLHGKVNHEVE